jgi:hypothetical protein
MPIYLYRNPNNGEVKEVFQSAFDEHTYEENGVKFTREFTIPYTASNTKTDPFDSQSFKSKFDGKNVKVGDMWDDSAEMSDRRKQKMGIDPVKEKFFDKYKEKRKGIKHPDDPRPCNHMEYYQKKAKEKAEKKTKEKPKVFVKGGLAA